MPDHVNAITRAIARGLSAKSAHVHPGMVFTGLDWKLAGRRPDGVAHSLFQLLHHMVFWQEWVVLWLEGQKPPRTAASWRAPLAPTGRGEWEQAVKRYQRSLANLTRRAREADLLVKRGQTSALDMLQIAISHNSYHTGQVVILRQLLRMWPPTAPRTRHRAA